MEQWIFEWDSYDLNDQFFDVTRVSDGEHFDVARIDYNKKTVEYINNGIIVEKHKLILTSELINE